MYKEIPFFMTNDEWYYYDDDERRYKLTNAAPDAAKKSYDDFYSEHIFVDENGDEWVDD